jgi:hypothetical protein
MSKDSNLPEKPSSAVAQFLDRVARTPVKTTTGEAGRLIFALDATASREPMWDIACQIQARMFTETAGLGGLQIQLCYYRGFQQFHCEGWCSEANRLLQQMEQVRCLGGATQIGRVLSHAVAEARQHKIQALVFIGDAIEEAADPLCATAGQLGLLNVPVFIFQEGRNQKVTRVFEQIAQLSGGACVPFNHHSADELRELLTAVAVYAAGGRKALADFSHRAGPGVALLTRQFKDQ